MGPAPRTTVLVADDADVRLLLTMAFQSQTDFELVGCVADGRAAPVVGHDVRPRKLQQKPAVQPASASSVTRASAGLTDIGASIPIGASEVSCSSLWDGSFLLDDPFVLGEADLHVLLLHVDRATQYVNRIRRHHRESTQRCALADS